MMIKIVKSVLVVLLASPLFSCSQFSLLPRRARLIRAYTHPCFSHNLNRKENLTLSGLTSSIDCPFIFSEQHLSNIYIIDPNTTPLLRTIIITAGSQYSATSFNSRQPSVSILTQTTFGNCVSEHCAAKRWLCPTK